MINNVCEGGTPWITISHHPQRLVMENDDPSDISFHPTLVGMIDYHLIFINIMKIFLYSENIYHN